MTQTHSELYSSLAATYQNAQDVEFPTNKIRFFMDFLWNATIGRPLSEEQKTSLKALIDLLNSFDDNKLSPPREMIAALTAQLTPLIATYPSLGHTFTYVVTTLIPSYQKYLPSLEAMVKNQHTFTQDEVLLYYDMTLIDHSVLAHFFESESSLNLIEVITAIKAIVQINALTHDYLQDSKNRSISLFTFLQRGGLAKDQCHTFYLGLVDKVLANAKGMITTIALSQAVEFLCTELVKLTVQKEQPVAATSAPASIPQPVLPVDQTQ